MKKNRSRAAFSDAGFKKWWMDGRSRDDVPASEAVRLAAWLEVPCEYLFGAAPEYEQVMVWEVASRASLDVFLKRHPEGRRYSQYRRAFENHLLASGESGAPTSVDEWVGRLDLVIRIQQEAFEAEGKVTRSLGVEENPGARPSSPLIGPGLGPNPEQH